MSATSPPTGSAYPAAPPRRPVGHRSHRLSRHLDLSSRLSRRQPPQAINRCRPHRQQPDRSRWRHRNLPSPATGPATAGDPAATGTSPASRWPQPQPTARVQPPMAPDQAAPSRPVVQLAQTPPPVAPSVGLGRVAPSATPDADVELTKPATGEDAYRRTSTEQGTREDDLSLPEVLDAMMELEGVRPASECQLAPSGAGQR